jgi:hypothetical protein
MTARNFKQAFSESGNGRKEAQKAQEIGCRLCFLSIIAANGKIFQWLEKCGTMFSNDWKLRKKSAPKNRGAFRRGPRVGRGP